jgi:general secretion pathway protein E
VDALIRAPSDPREALARVAAGGEAGDAFDRAFLERLFAEPGEAPDRAALERAMEAGAVGDRAHRLAARLGLASEAAVARTLAEVLGLPQMPAGAAATDVVQDGRIGARFLRDSRALPFAGPDGAVWVALADPLDPYPVEAIEYVLGAPVTVCVGTPSAIDAALAPPGDGRASIQDIVGGIETDPTEGDAEGADDVDRLRDLASEAPVVRLVNLLIARALDDRASDVHIESFEGALKVRYRIDGVLREVEGPPARLRAAVISRIKIMARLNIAERRLPQDGRIKLSLKGREVDLRVATTPGLHGENVVLRVLDRSGVALDLPGLGLDGPALAGFSAAIKRPNGVVLITGPTGSGKTTTLYAALIELNSPDRKVITAEDPVEYQIDGVCQIQVKPQIDLTFAAILRSVLRQDPDVIMVGEIRDRETASIAVQAALTGHLVVSTLHTNGAAAAVGRLLDMGVEDYLIASTLGGVLAQRLVRRLCPHCSRPQEVALGGGLGAAGLARRFLGRSVEGAAGLREPVGCPRCDGTGYRGRLAVVEFLPMTEAVARLVLARADVRQIHDSAVSAGMRPLFEDGVLKALAGLTSMDEILRVARED